MIPEARRTIDELVTLYDLEPEIRDVFVEGRSDQVVLAWYLKSRARGSVNVCEIDSIDVAAEIVHKHGLEIGSRGRAIALAYELEERLAPESQAGGTIVVDADFDRTLEVSHDLSTMLVTDYACLEMYLFNEKCIEKFLSLVTLGCSTLAHLVLSELSHVLVRLFAIRLTNHELGWKMSWLPFKNTCTRNGSRIMFAQDEFIRRYLMKSGKSRERDRFRSAAERNRSRLMGDKRHHINGHDFIMLLSWYLRPMVGDRRLLAPERTLERTLFACLELADLDEQKMFRDVLARVRA